MSEHEIAKHTKEIYKTWTAPNKNWKHKLFDILIEVAIIVFAITLSLFVERWREHLRDKKIEKQFLIGLKTDLENDLIQLKNDSSSYADIMKGWSYFRRKGINNEPLEKDSAAIYANTLFMTSDFIPNDSRFEALKSSGELGTIEDDSLQNKILDLYQNRIKSMQVATALFTKFHNEQLVPFLDENVRLLKDGSNNINDILQQPRMQNYLLLGNSSIEIRARYHSVIEQSMQIIGMIKKQYDLKE